MRWIYSFNEIELTIHAIIIWTFISYLLGSTVAEDAEEDEEGVSDLSSDSSGSSFTSEDRLILLDEPEDDDLMELEDDLGRSFNQAQPSASGELRL